MRHLSFIFALLVVIFLNINFANSQQVQIDFPEQGATNITKDPEIQVSITDNYHIDTSSIPFNHYRDTLVYDSTMGRLYRALIDFYPTSLYDGTDSSLNIAKIVGGRGYCEVVDSVNFTFRSSRFLNYNEEYGISIQGLRVYDPAISDTVTIDTLIENLFTTQVPPIKVMKSTVTKPNGVHCDDTLFLKFNVPLKDYDINNPPLVTVDSISYSVNDSGNVVPTYHSVQGEYYISPDSLKYGFIPNNNLAPGKSYGTDIKLSNYTADTTYDMYQTFHVRKTAEVSVSTSLLGAGTLPPGCEPYEGNSTYYINDGEEWTFHVPKFCEGYYFYEWFCPQDPENGIENDTIPRLSINFSCDELLDREYIAQYKKIPLDTLQTYPCLSVAGDTIGKAKVENYVDSLGNGKYTVQAFGSDGIYVCCEMMNDAVFSHWESNDTTYDNNVSPCVIINRNEGVDPNRIGKNIDLNPKGHLPVVVDCPTIDLGIEIRWADHTEGNYIPPTEIPNLIEDLEIIHETNSYRPDIDQDNNSPRIAWAHQQLTSSGGNYTVTVNLTMKDGYEIYHYIDERTGDKKGNYNKPHYQIGQSMSDQFTYPRYLESCSPVIEVGIRKARKYLKIQRYMENQSKLPNTNIVSIKRYNDDYSKLLSTKPVKNSRQHHGFYDEVEYELLYGTSLKLVPTVAENKGYDKVDWECGLVGQTYFTCQPQEDDPYELALGLTIDRDINARFIFRTGFKLIKIAVQKPYGGSAQFVPYDISHTEGDVVKEGLPFNRRIVGINTLTQERPDKIPGGWTFTTAEIQFIFDRPVDIETFYGKYFVYDISEYKENGVGMRLDGEKAGHYPFYEDNTYLEDHGGIPNSKVTLELKNQYGFETPHMSALKFSLKNSADGIQDINGNNLIRSYNFILETEMPRLDVELRDERVVYDEDPTGKGEYFCIFWGAVANQEKDSESGSSKFITGINQDAAIRIPYSPDIIKIDAKNPLDEYDIDIVDHSVYNQHMNVLPMFEDAYVSFGFHSTDKDCGESASKFQKIADKVYEAANSSMFVDSKVGIWLAAAAAGFYAGAWYCMWDDDDAISTGVMELTRQQRLWEANKLYHQQNVFPQGTINGSNWLIIITLK